MKRRDFLKQAAAAAGLPCMISRYARAQNQSDPLPDRTLHRDEVAQKLRPRIANLLDELEEKTGLKVEFRPLKPDFGVVAQYSFDQPKRPVVHLRNDWEDVDVAHELMHMQLELVDGYAVLAWRKNVPRRTVPETAFGLIRSYTDDMLVFERLTRMGLEIDGEVIKRQFFDDICTKVPRYLKAHSPLKYDGMAHLDNVAEGRYGDLRRSSFLVQAELFQKTYADKLSEEHKHLLTDFIATFRTYRTRQAERADQVLEFFEKYDIANTKSHARILTGWASLEELDKLVGTTRYVRRGQGFVLPFPSDYAMIEQQRDGQTSEQSAL